MGRPERYEAIARASGQSGVSGTAAAFPGSAGLSPDDFQFGLPPNVCVGGVPLSAPMRAGAGVGSASSVGARQPVTPQNQSIRIAGGPPPTAAATAYARPDGKLQASETWVPGRGGRQSVRTGYDRSGTNLPGDAAGVSDSGYFTSDDARVPVDVQRGS